MANQVHVQNLRGNTAKNNNYLGKDGELVINTESNSLRIHDGVTQGGHGTVYAARSETAMYAAMNDLAEGAIVIVGVSKPFKLYQKVEGSLVLKDLEVDIDIHKGNVTTSGNTGVLGIRKIGEDYYIDATFPEATIATGTVKTEGSVGELEIVKNSTNNYTVNATFPEEEVYAAHSESEEDSEELKELMAEGGIIIERQPGAKPVMKQVVEGELVATELSGGIQATYTENEDETASIIDEVEEGALIVEGDGPISVTAVINISADADNIIERKTDGLYVPDVKISADEKNTIEMKPDGLFTAGAPLSDDDPVVDGAGSPGVSEEGARSDHQHPRDIQAVWTENEGETESVLPDLAEGALIVEGNEHLVVETAAKVSAAAGNAIQRKTDGIFVESVKYGKTDPGAGSTLATGSIYLVYEE